MLATTQDSRGHGEGCGCLVGRLRQPRVHNPMVAAAMTQHNRSHAPLAGREATKGMAIPVPKASPLPAPISIPFTTLAMTCTNLTITTPTRLTGVSYPVLGRKTELPLNPFHSDGHSSTHTTAMAKHFPANAGPIFLTDELTNDRYLVDTGATLSIVPCTANSSPSGQPIPSWGFIQKTVQGSGQTFHFQFLASRCGRAHSGH